MEISIPDGINLRDPFVSRMPPELTPALAATNIGAAAYANIGDNLADDTMRLMQRVAATQIVNLGVPSGFVDAAQQLLSYAAYRQGADKWAVIRGTSKAVMDGALQLMGAIPVVGWAAQAVWNITEAVITAKTRHHPDPPMLSWNKAFNDSVANSALDVVASGDWTPLFRPPVGGFDVIDQEGGIHLDPRIRNFDSRFGCLPGSDTGMLGFTVADTFDAVKNTVGLERYLRGQVKAREIRPVYASQCFFTHDQLTPSLGKIALACWAQLTSKTSAMFNVDTRGIPGEWADMVEDMFKIGDEMVEAKIITDPKLIEQFSSGVPNPDAFYMFFAATAIGRYGTNFWPKDNKATRMDKYALQRLRGLRRRQEQAMNTLQVAWCSEKQPAFRDPELADLLRARRQQLLNHQARWKVVLADVPDKDFRAALAAATADPSKRPLRLKKEKGEFDGAIDHADALPDIGRAGVSAFWKLLAASGLAYGGYRLYKKYRR